MVGLQKKSADNGYTNFWSKYLFLGVLNKRQQILYRVSETDDNKYPMIRIQVVNSRATFMIDVNDIITSGDIQYFSTLDTIIITYIATICEVSNSLVDIPEISITGIKQAENIRTYVVKNLVTGECFYKSASELRKMPQYMSLTKNEIDKISYTAGYEDAIKKQELNNIISNNTELEILDVILGKGHVEMRIKEKRSNKIEQLDMTEILYNRNLLSKEDNFNLGKVSAMDEMNSFVHRQQDQLL